MEHGNWSDGIWRIHGDNDARSLIGVDKCSVTLPGHCLIARHMNERSHVDGLMPP